MNIIDNVTRMVMVFGIATLNLAMAPQAFGAGKARTRSDSGVEIVSRVDVEGVKQLPRVVQAVVSGDIEDLEEALEEEPDRLNEVMCFDLTPNFAETVARNPLSDMMPPVRPLTSVVTSREACELDLLPGGDDAFVGTDDGLPSGTAYRFGVTGNVVGQQFRQPGIDDWGHQVVLVGTPLMLASRIGNVRMMQALLKRGAKVNIAIRMKGVYYAGVVGAERPYISALTEAALPDTGVERMFMRYGEKTYVRMRPSYRKSSAVREKCIALLCKAGAVVMPTDGKGRTAAWDALNARSEALLQMAIDAGVNLAETDNFGRTVLDYCHEAFKKAKKADERRAWKNFGQLIERSMDGDADKEEAE